MPRTTQLLIERFQPNKKRKLLIVLALDVTLLGFGTYWIVSWATGRQNRTAHPSIEKPETSPTVAQAEALEADAGATPKPTFQAEGSSGMSEARHPTGHLTARSIGLHAQGRQARTGQTSSTPRQDSGIPNPTRREAWDAGMRAPAPDAAPTSRRDEAAPSRTDAGAVGTSPDPSYLHRLRQTFAAARNRVRRCYHEALKLAGKPIRGRIAMKVTIDVRSGTTVQVVTNTTGSPGLEKCVLAAAKALRYPPPPGGHVEVIYPLTFETPR